MLLEPCPFELLNFLTQNFFFQLNKLSQNGHVWFYLWPNGFSLNTVTFPGMSCNFQKRSKESAIMHKTRVLIVYHKHSKKCNYNTATSLVRPSIRVGSFFLLIWSNLTWILPEAGCYFGSTKLSGLFHSNALFLLYFDLQQSRAERVHAEEMERCSTSWQNALNLSVIFQFLCMNLTAPHKYIHWKDTPLGKYAIWMKFKQMKSFNQEINLFFLLLDQNYTHQLDRNLLWITNGGRGLILTRLYLFKSQILGPVV